MEIICALYYITALIYIILSIRRFFITPNMIFVMSQCVMFTGVTQYVDINIKADRILLWIYFIALISFIMVSSFFYTKLGLKYKKVQITENESLTPMQKDVIWLMVVVSILLCVYLFAKAGGNVFLQSFTALVGNDNYNIKFGRKNILGVSGVGYIYQFRTIILPILTIYLMNAGNKKEKKIAWLLFPLMIIFILGTGQRGGFVMFVIIWVVALLLIYKYYGEGNIRKIVFLGILFLMLFSLTTILNGRVKNDGSVFEAMLTRILDDNQACAVEGFRYIFEQPIQWGADWLAQVKDILPGKNDYQALSVRIFAIMNGGSTAGTAPACIWGSAFYNWGWFGVTIFPAILAYFHTYIYTHFLRKKSNRLRLFLYSGAFVVLGMWIADGPMVLFNQGFVTIILMVWIIRFSKKFVFSRRR